jgi:hypothetical protein
MHLNNPAVFVDAVLLQQLNIAHVGWYSDPDSCGFGRGIQRRRRHHAAILDVVDQLYEVRSDLVRGRQVVCNWLSVCDRERGNQHSGAKCIDRFFHFLNPLRAGFLEPRRPAGTVAPGGAFP